MWCCRDDSDEKSLLRCLSYLLEKTMDKQGLVESKRWLLLDGPSLASSMAGRDVASRREAALRHGDDQLGMSQT